MLAFTRAPDPHRVIFAAFPKQGRYEVEMLGERWYVCVYDQGHVSAIGDGEGFENFDRAASAAEADALVRIRQG